MLIDATSPLRSLRPRLADSGQRLVVQLLLLVLTVTALEGQTADTQSSESALHSGFSDAVSVAYILVPVVARSRGGYVKGLQAKDFILEVDGEVVDFESFDIGASAPVSLVFLQDLSGSMANAEKLSLSRMAIERILEGSGPADSFALASFSDRRLRVDISYTDDEDAIDKATALWEPYGVTGLHDAVSGLPELTRQRQSDKRAAVLITDGADNASDMSPAEARNQVRQAELPVYVLGLATGSPEDLDRDGHKLHRFADVLNLLAHLTGGQYFWIEDRSDVIDAASRIVEDLRHQYVLGFSTADSGELRYRDIEVRTTRKRVTLSFRKGYEGLPPRHRSQLP